MPIDHAICEWTEGRSSELIGAVSWTLHLAALQIDPAASAAAGGRLSFACDSAKEHSKGNQGLID